MIKFAQLFSFGELYCNLQELRKAFGVVLFTRLKERSGLERMRSRLPERRFGAKKLFVT